MHEQDPTVQGGPDSQPVRPNMNLLLSGAVIEGTASASTTPVVTPPT